MIAAQYLKLHAFNKSSNFNSEFVNKYVASSDSFQLLIDFLADCFKNIPSLSEELYRHIYRETHLQSGKLKQKSKHYFKQLESLVTRSWKKYDFDRIRQMHFGYKDSNYLFIEDFFDALDPDILTKILMN
jgi:hypothetical protein